MTSRTLSLDNRCVVCNERVSYKNFGTSVCCSCSSFFRRTLAGNKRYVCKQNAADCNIITAKHKRRCSYCRFSRCILVGMNVCKILTRMSSEVDKPMRQFVVCRRSNYTSRRKNAINLFGSFSGYETMKNQPRNATSLIRATAIESLTMRDYLRNVGLVESEQFDSHCENDLNAALLHTWLVCESVLFTRVHCSGQTKKQLYYADESFIQLNEDFLTDYYRSNSSLCDPDLVARSSYPLLTKVFESSELLQESSIDEHETAALHFLLLLRQAVKCFGGPNLKATEFQNRVFRELGFHYANLKAIDVAERFGRLMQCLESIERADRACDELALIVQLNYKKYEVERL
ncbi:Nuclear receptor domain-containing protein [Aphelenchoides besseyi]|nr:Nuclear receptor domain-containing protein [Aphelenchoides besseyi]